MLGRLVDLSLSYQVIAATMSSKDNSTILILKSHVDHDVTAGSLPIYSSICPVEMPVPVTSYLYVISASAVPSPIT